MSYFEIVTTTGGATIATAAQLPAALGAGGGVKVDGSGTALPVSGTVTANQGTAAAATGAWPERLVDRYAHEGFIDIRGQLKIAEPYRLIGAAFNGTTVDPAFWVAANSGAGSATSQATNLFTATSGTAAAGYAQLTTAQVARYIQAHPNYWRGLIALPDLTEADTTRYFGAFTVTTGVIQNGFCFAVDGAGALSIKRYTATAVSESVASGVFNGSVNSYVVDTNIHAWEVYVTFRQVEFYVDGVLLHTFAMTTTALSGEYNLRASILAKNGAIGGESADIQCFGMTMIRMGRPATQQRNYYFASGQTAAAGVVLKYGPGSIKSLVILGSSNTSVVTLYDNVTAGGTILAAWTMSAATANLPATIPMDDVIFSTGLTLTVLTANSQLRVGYE